MKVLKRISPLLALVALTTVVLPASAASRVSAIAPPPRQMSADAGAGHVVFTYNDKVVMSVAVGPQQGVDVRWNRHACTGSLLSPPEVFSWAGGDVPSSARPLLMPCTYQAPITPANAKAVVKTAKSLLAGKLACYMDSTFPYLHCFICPDEVECGPLTTHSQLANTNAGSEANLSLFGGKIARADVVNAQGKVTSQIKLPAHVNGAQYYANAATKTVNFDDLASGTAITTQYDGQGVDFSGGIVPTVEPASYSLAQTGKQVASISHCPGCKVFTPGVSGTLANPVQHVSVYVGYFHNAAAPGATASITLTALDGEANVIASDTKTVTEGQGFHTQLAVIFDSADISAFTITGSDNDNNKRLGIDDLAFERQ